MSFLKFQDNIISSNYTLIFLFYFALKIVWKEKTERGIIGKLFKRCIKKTNN